VVLFYDSELGNYPKTPLRKLQEKLKRWQERQKEKNIGMTLKED